MWLVLCFAQPLYRIPQKLWYLAYFCRKRFFPFILISLFTFTTLSLLQRSMQQLQRSFVPISSKFIGADAFEGFQNWAQKCCVDTSVQRFMKKGEFPPPPSPYGMLRLLLFSTSICMSSVQCSLLLFPFYCLSWPASLQSWLHWEWSSQVIYHVRSLVSRNTFLRSLLSPSVGSVFIKFI